MVSMKEIKRLADRIVREFQPQKIILFGSYAKGEPEPDSDVDVLVILPFEGKPFWKSLQIMNRIDAAFSLDLLVRKPEDARRRYEEGDPIMRDAFDHGEVLYERGA
jgi:predicted nucleotidyltransferase